MLYYHIIVYIMLYDIIVSNVVVQFICCFRRTIDNERVYHYCLAHSSTYLDMWLDSKPNLNYENCTLK